MKKSLGSNSLGYVSIEQVVDMIEGCSNIKIKEMGFITTYEGILDLNNEPFILFVPVIGGAFVFCP